MKHREGAGLLLVQAQRGLAFFAALCHKPSQARCVVVVCRCRNVTETKKKASKPKTGGKSITEVKKTAPKNGMTPDKPRGTRKDYTLNKKLKKK
jgi:hypothetical protein